MNEDVWLIIVRFSNGKTRHDLSQLNHHFRTIITNHHIFLLKQEQRRIQSFVTDVQSTTVERFVNDFEKVKKDWKPPYNYLYLHYVDYNYHLLFVSLEMLAQIESYQLFFHFTNGSELSLTVNL